jgi:hypothetical protein
MFLSLALAIGCGVLMFAGYRQGPLLDIAFGLCVACFLGTFAMVVSRRAAAMFQERPPKGRRR